MKKHKQLTVPHWTTIRGILYEKNERESRLANPELGNRMEMSFWDCTGEILAEKLKTNIDN